MTPALTAFIGAKDYFLVAKFTISHRSSSHLHSLPSASTVFTHEPTVTTGFIAFVFAISQDRMRQRSKLEMIEQKVEGWSTTSKRLASCLFETLMYFLGLYTLVKNIFH